MTTNKIEVKGYGFWVGKIPYRIPSFLIPKRIREAIKVLVNSDGFIGLAPIGNKTLVLYETLNDAKRARNRAKMQGIRVFGNEIEEIDTFAEGKVTRSA